MIIWSCWLARRWGAAHSDEFEKEERYQENISLVRGVSCDVQHGSENKLSTPTVTCSPDICYAIVCEFNVLKKIEIRNC